jgi:hypothetical protein
LLSLASRFGITLATIPNAVPYLSISPSIDHARLVHGRGETLSVGLVWAGSQSNTNDANRSIPLEHFFPLTGIADVECFSLQIGPRAVDLGSSGATSLIHDLSPSITDFADTAALIRQLDLVITVDTAVAHLAGALGHPAFVLLPYTPDWRWLGSREDSPWYPSLRLFRQKTPRDWQAIICDVTAAVTEFASKRR